MENGRHNEILNWRDMKQLLVCQTKESGDYPKRNEKLKKYF